MDPSKEGIPSTAGTGNLKDDDEVDPPLKDPESSVQPPEDITSTAVVSPDAKKAVSWAQKEGGNEDERSSNKRSAEDGSAATERPKQPKLDNVATVAYATPVVDHKLSDKVRDLRAQVRTLRREIDSYRNHQLWNTLARIPEQPRIAVLVTLQKPHGVSRCLADPYMQTPIKAVLEHLYPSSMKRTTAEFALVLAGLPTIGFVIVRDDETLMSVRRELRVLETKYLEIHVLNYNRAFSNSRRIPLGRHFPSVHDFYLSTSLPMYESRSVDPNSDSGMVRQFHVPEGLVEIEDDDVGSVGEEEADVQADTESLDRNCM